MTPYSQQSYDVTNRIAPVMVAEGALLIALQAGEISAEQANANFTNELRQFNFSDRYIEDARQHALSILASHRAA